MNTTPKYFVREILDLYSETYFFQSVYRMEDTKHVTEIEELAYTYLVECLTKSNKELKADRAFAINSINTLWAEKYADLIEFEPYSEFLTKRNDIVRVINRHKVIEFISDRLLSVVKVPLAAKLEMLITQVDTPIFNVAFEYAENHQCYFPGYVKAIDNIELVRHLDNRYLFSATRYFNTHRNESI